MQQISQGSLKLQAHHDKIANQTAHTTKAHFLDDELYFLNSLKDTAQTLQHLAKPTPNPQLQKLTKLTHTIRTELQEQIITTRRQTALIELAACARFEQMVAQRYEQAVGELAARLQTIEDLVQQQEDIKRLNAKIAREAQINVSKLQYRQTVDAYISRREAVKEQIKKRLVLAGKLKQKKEASKGLLVKSKQQYHFNKEHKKLYRNKSNDALLKTNVTPLNLQPYRRRFRQQMLQIQIKVNSRLPLPLLTHLQSFIYTQALQQLKSDNLRLQASITVIKNALQARDNHQTLLTLASSKDLDHQHTKARQILAYLNLNQAISNKIDACSHRWAQQKPSSPKHKGQGKQEAWVEQRLLDKRSSIFQPIRSSSSGRQLSQSRPIVLNLPLRDPLKSNERTNCSLQGLERPL